MPSEDAARNRNSVDPDQSFLSPLTSDLQLSLSLISCLVLSLGH